MVPSISIDRRTHIIFALVNLILSFIFLYRTVNKWGTDDHDIINLYSAIAFSILAATYIYRIDYGYKK